MNLLNALHHDLQSFVPTTPRETGFFEQMLTLTHSAAPFSREQFTPGHFTASAFVLSPDKQSILLIFHEKLKMWLQPGGHVETSDVSLEAAARRELAEETGVSNPQPFQEHPGIFSIDIHDIPCRKSDPEHRHYDVRYLFVAQNLFIQPASDALDARWVKLTDVADIQTDESVLNTVETIRMLMHRTSRLNASSPLA